MIKFLSTICFCLLSLFTLAQTISSNTTPIQPYGKVDTADLKMTSCSFEKDANAMVLFDHASVFYEDYTIVMERHRRIKIFNEHGKDEANIRMVFYGVDRNEVIKDIEAETINLKNNSIEYTAIDKKLIYTEVIDKESKAIIFTFPNVKAGSIIEFKYKWMTPFPHNYPNWFFQSAIPTRYSEFNGSFDKAYQIEGFERIFQPMTKDSAVKSNYGANSQHIWVLSNIKSYKAEPYMDYPEEYWEGLIFKVGHIKNTWLKVGNNMLWDEDFGKQLDTRLNNTDTIIAKARALKTDDEKIRYIFNTVKKTMNWNKRNYWFTVDGVKKAWNKRTGNSTEINIILYNLLKEAGVKTYLMVFGTRNYGKINIDYPSVTSFNKTAVYYLTDSTHYDVLDASSPYNTYNNTPVDLMGVNVFCIDPDKKKFGMFQIKNMPVKEASLIEGSINTDGELIGNAQMSNSAYGRKEYLQQYNTLGEKRYIDQVQSENNGLKITSLELENVENDTLPLVQTFKFKYSLANQDGGYMYFNPNIFTGFDANPFLSETRISDIDFKGLYNYSINAKYKIPEGYKVDALPKSITMQMPDHSITFKRLIGENEGVIEIHYLIDYKKAQFPKEVYPDIRDFYKKMYELLNEQVVLKKL